MDLHQEQPEHSPAGRDADRAGGQGQGQQVPASVHHDGGGEGSEDGDDSLAGVSDPESEEDLSDTEEVDWEEHSSVGGSSPGGDERNDPAKQGILFQGGQGPLACWIRTGGPEAWKAHRPLGLYTSGPGGVWGSGAGCGLPKCACSIPLVRREAKEAEEGEGYDGDDEGPIQGRHLKRLAEACIGEAGDTDPEAYPLGMEQGRKRRKVIPGKVHRGYEEGFHVQHGQARGHHLRLPEEDNGLRGHGPFKRASGESTVLGHGGSEERLSLLR